jgi:hypothetical protein
MKTMCMRSFRDPARVASYWLNIAKKSKANLPDPNNTVLLLGRKLRISGKIVDLSRKPMMVHLFRSFMMSPDMRLSRRQIIESLYGSINSPTSQRLKNCQAHSAIRLLSRTRSFLEKNTNQLQNIEWFKYCSKTETWTLITRSSD